jgi:hypothetical protein
VVQVEQLGQEADDGDGEGDGGSEDDYPYGYGPGGESLLDLGDIDGVDLAVRLDADRDREGEAEAEGEGTPSDASFSTALSNSSLIGGGLGLGLGLGLPSPLPLSPERGEGAGGRAKGGGGGGRESPLFKSPMGSPVRGGGPLATLLDGPAYQGEREREGGQGQGQGDRAKLQLQRRPKRSNSTGLASRETHSERGERLMGKQGLGGPSGGGGGGHAKKPTSVFDLKELLLREASGEGDTEGYLGGEGGGDGGEPPRTPPRRPRSGSGSALGPSSSKELDPLSASTGRMGLGQSRGRADSRNGSGSGNGNGNPALMQSAPPAFAAEVPQGPGTGTSRRLQGPGLLLTNGTALSYGVCVASTPGANLPRDRNAPSDPLAARKHLELLYGGQTFHWEEAAPEVFAALREAFGLTKQQYQASMADLRGGKVGGGAVVVFRCGGGTVIVGCGTE